MTTTLENARQTILSRISTAERTAGRSAGAVSLLAVSKTFPASAVRELYLAGQYAFGENYVQELVAKSDALADLPGLIWHFIGPLQSNKTRAVAERAHWVHSIDRLKIAERLSSQRPTHLPSLNVCLQVNVSGEASKSGCQPEDAVSLAAEIAELPRLTLRGLMCIPEPTDDLQRLRQQFISLRQLFEQLQKAGYPLDTLSMGMSADLELAIAEGATLVRVGTAIFGARSQHP
ncbi:YggS family pyridoxal phosphate-dependent enzyme [Parachitinimonas caeni]|uniref:Pyridoxal phosphate homeostasis protein n=1 Tax=Parachitinimonas caeni TaxID=3031301 RepID=A0ABT7DW32_9NEIS|nr:YggS family pyridoxal phosphate-dependent enzyme [Parachitinimonas caeni]MDK2124258.1 YggS family pyridoxal phosphate-dependent enzyme [Parachitinimonas caeni]